MPSCGANSYFSSNNCVCKKNYYLIDGSCEKCPAGTAYSYKRGQCISICGDHAYYKHEDKRCYCNDGYYIINRNGNIGCGKCESGEEYDEDTKTCSGKCPFNEIQTSNGCSCKSGYNRIKGKCIKCP